MVFQQIRQDICLFIFDILISCYQICKKVNNSKILCQNLVLSFTSVIFTEAKWYEVLDKHFYKYYFFSSPFHLPYNPPTPYPTLASPYCHPNSPVTRKQQILMIGAYLFYSHTYTFLFNSKPHLWCKYVSVKQNDPQKNVRKQFQTHLSVCVHWV